MLILKKSNTRIIKAKENNNAYQGALGIDDIEPRIQQVVIKTPLVISINFLTKIWKYTIRKLKLQISVDGYVAGPNGEEDWKVKDCLNIGN